MHFSLICSAAKGDFCIPQPGRCLFWPGGQRSFPVDASVRFSVKTAAAPHAGPTARPGPATAGWLH